jgi:hypothetical protein
MQEVNGAETGRAAATDDHPIIESLCRHIDMVLFGATACKKIGLEPTLSKEPHVLMKSSILE